MPKEATMATAKRKRPVTATKKKPASAKKRPATATKKPATTAKKKRSAPPAKKQPASAEKKPATSIASGRSRRVTKKQAVAQLEKGIKWVKWDDLLTVLDQAAKILKAASEDPRLKKFLDDVKLMLEVIQAYVKGEYRAIPYWSIAAIVAALLYVLNPLDLIPDVIPIVGYVDDALVIAACLAMVEQDLQNYKEWKIKHA